MPTRQEMLDFDERIRRLEVHAATLKSQIELDVRRRVARELLEIVARLEQQCALVKEGLGHKRIAAASAAERGNLIAVAERTMDLATDKLRYYVRDLCPEGLGLHS